MGGVCPARFTTAGSDASLGHVRDRRLGPPCSAAEYTFGTQANENGGRLRYLKKGITAGQPPFSVRPSGARTPRLLNVVVQLELVRVRPQLHGQDLAGAL